MAGKIYIATQTGVTTVDGKEIQIQAGVTRVREGHPLLKGREALFRELNVHYDLEDARSAPEEKKPVPEPEQAETPEKKEPAGLTSKDAPAAPRGRRRVTKTD